MPPLDNRPTDDRHDAERIDLRFSDNRLVPLLYGEHDANLTRIEHALGISITTRGNMLSIFGTHKPAIAAEAALTVLWNRLQDRLPVDNADIDAAVRMALEHHEGQSPADLKLKTRRRPISPRTPMQATFMKAMEENELVFALGPAGTGKTYLAVAQAVALMQAGQIDRIVLSRPAVEAGERLGFLPGDLKEKIDPYLRPIYDALNDLMPAEIVEKRMMQGTIEVAPLAFMRGRTLSRAFVLLDEAQNTTPMQMKMALTRIGEGSRMVVTGDLTQIDLPYGVTSGLHDAVDALEQTEGISFIRFSELDVVRHPLVGRIVQAYERRQRQRDGQ